jgi:hypothetical protein
MKERISLIFLFVYKKYQVISEHIMMGIFPPPPDDDELEELE